MFYCPLCGRRVQERPFLAVEPGQIVLHCPVCEFTIRTHMTYRELYAMLGHPLQQPNAEHRLAA